MFIKIESEKQFNFPISINLIGKVYKHFIENKMSRSRRKSTLFPLNYNEIKPLCIFYLYKNSIQITFKYISPGFMYFTEGIEIYINFFKN